MANTLTGLIPTIYTALDSVSREQVGFIPAVARNSKAEAAALDQNVTAPVAPIAKTVDIVPGPTAAGSAEQTISTVEVKISKSKMAPVQWNGEEQMAMGSAGSYNLLLADQFKQAFRALANEVEAQITQAFQSQLDEASSKNNTLEAQLYQEMIGSRFNSSTFIKDNLAIPADLVQARFGQAFNIEAGKVVATDAAGNKVFSRRRPGEMAEFDEALEYLIEQYPHKDHILKASGHSGGGSQQTQPPLGQKTLKRSAFDALDSGSKQAALKDGMSIVD
ncbi:DUF6651 domain-containing protein [Candidatus Regiella endosymbiont of Tuberolachnus salignus]|uniref:DUF6651 domain-containing protein n=1 Tax=Candidatus Regiella endosymbiont of Tuberolachnus salignus TaxID=3077956 RepID=UPI0030CF6BC5